jgi:hypothetical protein
VPNAAAPAATSGYGLSTPDKSGALSRSRPDHAMFFHWLPWALPLGAIGLPEIILVILGTGIAKHMTCALAAESVNRGDLLIPVIIICAEAFRRWWDTEFNNTGVAACAGFFAVISGLFALIAIAAYAVVLANPQTRGFADIADTFTWAPLACGLIAGTIAIGQTAPRKTGKP